MNCQLCRKELEEYREGKLPEGIKDQVEMHLQSCEICAEIYDLESIAYKVMEQEKEIQSNPFLATRIMASIEAMKVNRNSPVGVLKPLIITVSISAAILIGIVAGTAYEPTVSNKGTPIELTFIDDATIESVELLAID